jgi:hypothetical protein
MALKYGKLAPKFNPKTLLLSKYLLPSALPPPPEKRAWEYAVPDTTWAQSMLGNDQVGDCVIAAMLHYIMAATANTGKPVTFTTDQAIQIYSAITGYVPGDPSTDNGTAWTDALEFWQTNGIFGHYILGWASIQFQNLTSLRQGVDIFGATLIGTAVTESMENQFGAGQPWNPPFSGGTVGLHGIPMLGYGSQGQTVITWAAREQEDLTAPSLHDEAYVPVTQDWLDSATGLAPNTLDLDTLNADLKLIAA